MTGPVQTASQRKKLDKITEAYLVNHLRTYLIEELGGQEDAVSADATFKSLDVDSLELEELIMSVEAEIEGLDLSEVPRNEITSLRILSKKIMEVRNEDQ